MSEDSKDREDPVSKLSDIILQKNGDYFRSKNVAFNTMDSKGLDPTQWEVKETDKGGWYIQRINSDAAPPSDIDVVWWVIFSEKSATHQTRDVELGVNGEMLVIQRGKRVPVPEKFLEVADHAKYPIWKQEPGEVRKVAGYVLTYPYQKLDRATLKDFTDFKKDGAEAAKKLQEADG